MGSGFLAAFLLLCAELRETLDVLGSTLPVLARISGPENARND
jgi:hypothetical protein